MISVVIPTEGVEAPIVATLAALVPGAAAGVIREVTLVDRTPDDVIARVADVAGCHFLACDGSRAAALAAGAKQARSAWLMFLHPGAVLDSGWIDETTQFIQNVSLSGRQRAGVFRYARSPYAEGGWSESFRQLSQMFGSFSADQGLLIARAHYDSLGGYAPEARHAESRLLSKIGRGGRAVLRTRIFVPA
ncbi:MAG TPA: hypothetical protein VL100_04725 [Croceibacterium sp.]|nr:hypothetical protein [Croceibacterium sp.]